MRIRLVGALEGEVPPLNMASTFDPSTIAFGAKKDTYVSTTMNGRLPRFVLGSIDAPLRAPHGVSTPYSGAESAERLTMDLEVQSGELLDALTALDELIVTTAVERSKEWFGRQVDEPTARAWYTPLVKPSKDVEKYPNPTVRTKFSLKRGKETKVRVPTGGENAYRPGRKDDIVKGADVCVEVTMTSVMLGNRSFSASLTVEQVLLASAAEGPSAGITVFGANLVLEE